MDKKDWDHGKMSAEQQRLFRELRASGRPNTMAEHNRIAIQPLMAGGDKQHEAVYLLMEKLAEDGVFAPGRIPWSLAKGSLPAVSPMSPPPKKGK